MAATNTFVDLQLPLHSTAATVAPTTTIVCAAATVVTVPPFVIVTVVATIKATKILGNVSNHVDGVASACVTDA